MPWDGYGSARSWVLAIFVGAILGLFEAVLGSMLDAGATISSQLASVGDEVASSLGKVGAVVLEIMQLPFEVVASAAGGLGPFAPIAVFAAWGLSAAMAGLLLYVVWRVALWI